ncbi:MAG: chemotaxis protein [Candidatus Krumholzibacteria bacterium]|jgi:two-component system chemotaxis response regulator CheV|nr:chemotaxis protein [Candidatus Krumholzibacteria bacterium]
MKAKEGILLESGTNEVEILEFELGGQGFGVNVLKVQAIEQFEPAKVTEIQLAHPAVIGSYQYRDHVITLIDLGQELRVCSPTGDLLSAGEFAAVDAVVAAVPGVARPAPQAVPQVGDSQCAPAAFRIVLVLEFNEQITGFLVDGVNRIHRVSWNAISPLSPFLAAVQSKFTGSLQIEGREILVMDMERILSEILPQAGRQHRVKTARSAAPDQRRRPIPLLLAEDSVTIRSLLAAELSSAGYDNVAVYDNGQTCLNALRAICERANAEGSDPRKQIGAVVSDIEMPQLDGMTLCRRIKTELNLRDVPVILFSSLINEQIALKCQAVGADAYLSKPRFGELVEVIDRHVLGD